MGMDFNDHPAVVEVFPGNQAHPHCLSFSFVDPDQKAKLKGMSVRQALTFVLEHAEVDAFTDEVKRDLDSMLSGTPNASLDVYGHRMSRVSHPARGTTMIDERDASIDAPRYWAKQQDPYGNPFWLSQIRVAPPPGTQGSS